MSTGITKTLEVIGVIEDLAVRLIKLAKSRSVFELFTLAPTLFADVSTVASDATLVVPELADVDAKEFGRLGEAAYDLVTAVVTAIKA